MERIELSSLIISTSTKFHCFYKDTTNLIKNNSKLKSAQKKNIPITNKNLKYTLSNN